jgi:hypothetical protein
LSTDRQHDAGRSDAAELQFGAGRVHRGGARLRPSALARRSRGLLHARPWPSLTCTPIGSILFLSAESFVLTRPQPCFASRLDSCARSGRNSTSRLRPMRRRRVRALSAKVPFAGSYLGTDWRVPLLSLVCARLRLTIRSQDPERPAHPDGAARAHQRQPRAQGVLAHRVR